MSEETAKDTLNEKQDDKPKLSKDDLAKVVGGAGFKVKKEVVIGSDNHIKP